MKRLKRVLIWLVIMLFAVIISLIFLVNSPRFLEKSVQFVVKKYVRDLSLEKIRIETVHSVWPPRLVCEKIKLTIKKDGQLFYVDVGTIDIGAQVLANISFNHWNISFQEMNVYSALANVSKAEGNIFLKIMPSGVVSYEGAIRVLKIVCLKYLLTDVSGWLHGDLNRINLSALRWQFYGGVVSGEIILDSKEDLPYSVHLYLTDVDIQALSKDAPEALSQIKGRVNGEAAIEGNIKKLSAFKAHLEAPHGGMIKAKLLQPLMDYMPQTKERQDFDALVKVDGDVPVEDVQVNIKSVSDVKLENQIHFLSKKLNIEPNVIVDVNIDGGLNNFLKSLYQSFGK